MYVCLLIHMCLCFLFASNSTFAFGFLLVCCFFVYLCLFFYCCCCILIFFSTSVFSKHEALASFVRHFVVESQKKFIVSIRFTLDWTVWRWLTSNLLRFEIFIHVYTFFSNFQRAAAPLLHGHASYWILFKVSVALFMLLYDAGTHHLPMKGKSNKQQQKIV